MSPHMVGHKHGHRTRRQTLPYGAIRTDLVTENEGEFSRVKGLEIENWLR
jgi:hypothetical protein